MRAKLVIFSHLEAWRPWKESRLVDLPDLHADVAAHVQVDVEAPVQRVAVGSGSVFAEPGGGGEGGRSTVVQIHWERIS